MKKYFYLLLSLTFVMISDNAWTQWYNNSTVTNAGGLTTDLGGQAYNEINAIYSTAGSSGAPSNYGVFNHWGQSGNGANAAFINNGSYDASVNGRDYFSGPGGSAGQQEISGTVMPIFGELFLENGATSVFNITNTNGIRITTAVTFNNGITTTIRNATFTGAIKLDDNATIINIALGDGQHVNGYISKKGDDAFLFPVGSGADARTLSVTAPANPADEYAVAWIAGDPSSTADPSDGGAFHSVSSITAPIASVSATGQWDWITVSGTGASLTVSVSIPDMSGSGIDPADLRLVGWNGSSWVNLSGPSGATGNTEGSTLSGTMQAGITAIAIGAINNLLLPVSFVDFNVAKQGNTAALTWITASEQNNKGFELQRSADGINWNAITFVNSKAENGNSSVVLNYQYTDPLPFSGTNFYRLKQIDVNGQYEYSTIQTVDFAVPNKLRIYPNPVINNELYIKGLNKNSRITINHINGQVLISETVTNSNIKTVDMSKLPQGVYILHITDEKGVQTNRKIIRN